VDIPDDGAAAALQAAITDHANILGPAITDEELSADESPTGDVLLCEWVAVMAWIDEDGRMFTTQVTPGTMPAHHRVGLLHEALYGFD
jgi:hypothetical protein